MMSWIKAQTGGSSVVPATMDNMDKKKVEPGAAYSLFENHWAQAQDVMKQNEDSDGALIVISHLSQMITLLGMTRGESVDTEKSCKSFWLQHRCSDQVIGWLNMMQVKGMQLPEEDELKLVAMLHSLCEAASRDGELLGYVTSSTEIEAGNSWDGTYALASLLLEYSLRSTVALAETARYSFIQLIQLAAKFDGLERSFSQESGLGLTNVVVSGLSACFSQLPTFTKASSSQLSPFIGQLRFVDEVAQAASDSVADTVGICFTNAFLTAVIEPALIQSLNEEIAIVTFYLEIVCRNISHPALVKNLIHFVNDKLLNVLIHRLNTNESVNVVSSTLSLLHVLLEFYCEDFWLEIILKHLTPQQHLMVSKRRLCLPPIDYYDSSTEFLQLLPTRVCEILGADVIETSFILYLNQVSAQWSEFDSKIGTAISISRLASIRSLSTCENSNQPYHASPNPTFPMWKLKYDGTEAESLEKNSLQNGYQEVVSEQTVDQPEAKNSELVDVGVSVSDFADPLNSALSDGVDFTTINLDHGSIEDVRTSSHSRENGKSLPRLEKLSILTNQSDGYVSMEGSESPSVQDNYPSSTVASFGPFLDSLFVQLSNWPHLDLNVILILTQIVSLLAACRIPLINSLLIDPTLTLQPCYITFKTLLKRIREDLEYQLKDVPAEVIGSVWMEMGGNQEVPTRRSSGFGGGSLVLSHSFSNQLGDTIRKTIGGGGAEAIANVWKKFNRITMTTSPTAKAQVHPSSGAVLKTDGPQTVRYESKVESLPDPSRIMAMRIIFFSHWLLELAAIAEQQCWKAAYD